VSLRLLVEGLTEANVSFVVVGMVAGQMYGSRTATYDLDIVYEASDENITRLAGHLLTLDAYVKETWPNEGVASDFSRDVLVREQSLALGTREGELDVLHRIDGIGGYAEVRELSQPVRLGNGRDARVILLSALIASKRASNRDKDRLHIVELEAIGECQAPPRPPEN
jgi:hypothetical protein